MDELKNILQTVYKFNLLKSTATFIIFKTSTQEASKLIDKLKRKKEMLINPKLYYIGDDKAEKLYKFVPNITSDIDSKKLIELIK